MKDNRQSPPWQTGLTVFTAVLGLLMVLLLGGCSETKPETTPSTTAPAETTPTVTDAPTTAPTTEATTAPTEPSATEPATEPSTEPATAPTTAPTEPATEPTSGGNSTPGGAGGYYPGGSGNSGSAEEETKPVEEFVPAQPGTAENPYMEDLSAPPKEITSVFVPAAGEISYELYALDQLVVTVQDPEAYIIHKNVTYLPNEDGILSVTLTPAVTEAPETDAEEDTEEESTPGEEQPEEEPEVREWFVTLPFTLGSKAEAEKAFTLSFTETEGGVTNPQIIGSVDVLTTVLEENDRNGYHYLWTAAEDDTIVFSLESVTPETAVADVYITKGETTLSLRADGVENENKVIELAVDVLAEEQLLIQVITAKDEEGNYPAAAVVLMGRSTHAEGTETNPAKAAVTQIPFDLTTIPVPAGQGSEVWYEITGAGGCILTVADADAYILYGDNTFVPDENGIVAVELAAAGRVPAVLRIGNNGIEEKTFQMSFAYPEGGMMAPVEITDISVINAVTGTDGTVCCSWTATGTGVVQILVPDSPEAAAYDVEVNNITLGSYKTLAADASTGDIGTYILNYVRQGDILQILVSAKDASAGLEVTLEGYVLGNGESPLFVSGEQLNLPVAGGEEVTLNAYCYEHTMTISSSNAYIIFGDQRFEPVDGAVSVTFPVNPDTMGRPVPLAIVVGNSSEAVQTYEIRFEAPVGSAINPQKIETFSEVNVRIPEGDSDGAWVYSWTAEQTGILHVSVYNETEGVEYEISVYNPATGAYMNLSEDGVKGDLGTYVQTYVRQGDTVEITVSAAGQMGSDFVMRYPALDLTLSGYMVGTEDSPMFLGETSFVIPLADKSHIPVMGYCYTQTMTITGENIYVVYDGSRYEPVEGVITLTFPENPVMVGRPEPIQFVIGNDNDFALKLPVLMEFPLGSRSNPEELVQLQPIRVSLEAENPEGYYYKWTALADGTLTFRITEVTEKLQGDIVLTNENSGAQRSLAGEQADAVSIPVTAGDVILVQLVAVPDEKDWSYPAIDIAAMGEFTEKE